MDEFRRRQPCLQGACALCLQRRQVFGKAPVLARRGRPWSGAVRDGVGTCSCSWASEVRNSFLPHSYLTFFSLALPGREALPADTWLSIFLMLRLLNLFRAQVGVAGGSRQCTRMPFRFPAYSAAWIVLSFFPSLPPFLLFSDEGISTQILNLGYGEFEMTLRCGVDVSSWQL